MTSLSPADAEFGADRTLLGFAYQVRYGLYLFYEAQRVYGLDVAVDIEAVDDIDVHAGASLTKLVQTKHTATVLTNSSAPLWKTVRIWCEAIRRAKVDLQTIGEFRLVTTSENPADDLSVVNLLQQNTPEGRRDALSEMRSLAAKKAGQKTLGRAYTAFRDLPALQQEQLISKIVIQTKSLTFDELDLAIQEQIVHGPPDKREAFAKVLFAGWSQLVESHLRAQNRTKIEWQQLQSLLHEIALEFDDDNLPTEFADMLRDALPALTDDERVFMKQLAAIGASAKDRQRAQRHFLRSTQLLDFWQRNLLVRPDEVMNHRRKLVDECELRHELVESDSQFEHQPPEEVGKHVYRWAILDAANLENLRIRPRCADADIIRGCFHTLADAPHLGWHPNWKNLFNLSSSGD